MQHFYSNCTTVFSSFRTVSTRVLASAHLLSRTLFLLLALALSCGAWGGANTTSDNIFATGNTTFEKIGIILGENTYWYNGIKLYSCNSQSIKQGGDRFTTQISVPSYIEDVTSGEKWGSYSLSGLGIQQHALAVHLQKGNNLEVIVHCNSLTACGLTIGLDNVEYGTAYTTSTYKDVSQKVSITPTRDNNTGRYHYKYTASEDCVVKFLYSSSGTGAGKIFVYESINVTSSCTKPIITTQPVSDTYPVGATPTLQVVATGDALTYQWQSSTDNTTFADISNATNDTYTPPTDKAGTTYYRCIVSSGSCSTTSASATITIAADNTVYLKPNSNWLTDNARFAVYYWNGSDTHWANMTRVSECEEVYMAQIPANYTNIIFCRMNPSTTENSFGESVKWNQTADCEVKNTQLYTIAEGVWDKGNGSWSTYTPVECINRWYVSGNFNNFSLTHPFTNNQVAITLAANTTYEFKIQHQVGNTYSWFGNPSTMTSTNCAGWDFGMLGKDDTNAKITTTIAGAYLFTMSVNPNGTPKLTVTYPALHTIKYDANMPTAWGKVVPFYAANIPAKASAVSGESYTIADAAPQIQKSETENYVIYNFAGWNTQADGKGTTYQPSAKIDNISSNITLYAQWTPREFNITYYDDDQTTKLNLTPDTYTYPTSTTFPTPPTRAGYTFVGWKNNTGTEDYTKTDGYYGDFALYAVWKKFCGEMMRATITGEKTSDVTGSYAGSAEVQVQKNADSEGGYKLGSNGHYIKLTLADGATFQEGDYVVVNVTQESTCLELFADKGTTRWCQIPNVVKGENIIGLPEAAFGKNTIYLYRTSKKMNPYVSYMSVVRSCCTKPDFEWKKQPAKSFNLQDPDCEILAASTQSKGAVTYMSNDEKVATIVDGNKLHFEGEGSVTITATLAAEGDYCEMFLYTTFNVVDRCGEAYIYYNLPAGTDATTLSVTETVENTTGLTAQTAISANNITLGKSGKNNDGEDLTVEISNTSSLDKTKYLAFTYTVAAGQCFTPCQVGLKVQPIGTACKFLIEMTDGISTWTSEELASKTAGVVSNIRFSNAANISFSGNVTLKIYSYGSTNGYRLGTPVRILGTVADVVTATIVPDGGVIPDAAALGWILQADGNYTKSLAKGSNLTMPDITRDGYTFIVYHDHNKDTYYPGNTFPLNQDYTFTAQWIPLTPTGKVKVTLDLNGGTFKNADDEALWTKEISTDGYYYMAIQEGYPLSLPELVPPTDKFFEGYLDQNSDRYEVNTPYNIYGNIDFVADWCSNQVTLTWKCDNWETGTTNTFVLNSNIAVKDYPQLTISGTPEGAEIHYSSSDPAVAIIRDNGEIVPYMAGETTITAMFDGEGDYCSAETSYTLVVECNEPTPVIEGVGDLSGCNTTIMLRVRQKNAEGTISDYPAEGFSFQWYKDDKAIEGATQVTYTVQTVGDYFVVVHKFCYAQSENTAHITTSQAEPEVVRLAPFQFYRPKHTYPAEQATRHLFSYKSADTDASKCALTAALKRSGEQPADIAEADLRTFIAISATPDSRGYYTVTADLNSVPTSLGLQAGDTLALTLTPFDNCGSLSTAYAEQIDIRIVSKPALAFIISGADQLTRDKADFTLHGDFLTGINRADLYKQSAKNWADADLNTPLPLYTAIQKEFEVVPVNGYADFNLYNYEPFDILLLTDFVRTGIGSKGSTIVTVIDSLAKLVDYRPMFSLKAHMAKKEFPTWKTKGFIANPAKPAVNPQKDMTVLCLAHNIFEGLPEYKGTAVPTPEQQYQNNIIYTADGNIVVRITSEGGFDDGKALQGFEAVDATNFVNIGIIPSGKNNGTLIACCERQANINARLLILSVNADATCKLTPIGCQAIIKGLNYLLETDPVKVSDCSVTFHNENGKGDHLWTTPTNWSTGRVPLKEQNIQIAANCIVNTPEATAATVKIIADSTLTIQPKGALTVNGQIWTIPSETDKHNTSEITDPSMITILSDASGVGALVRAAGDDARLAATVQMYSKAYFEWVDGKRKKYWQYVGVPIQTAAVPECFYGAYTYLWEEANGWTRKSDGTILEQFKGYGLSVGNQENTKLTYTLRGDLATSDNRNITLTINNSNENYRGTNMIGNSWTAPIHIDKMLATDFGTANATVYIYNTGRDDQQTAATSTVTGDVDATQPGQWIAITPGLAAQSDYAGLKVIPAMQAFDILTESETSLYLDYERVVRGGGTADINTPMRAPQSNKSGNGITLMRVTVADSQTHTDLYLMQHQAFTDAFDNGWDATYMACDGRSASLYAITPIGEMAVAAIPEIEGINLGFAPGKETEYTFSFGYTGSMLYLNDTRERRSTLITDWNTYRFTASDNDDANRFYISATPIEAQVPSGLVEVSDNHGVLTLSNPAHENLSICLYDAAGRLCATTSTADAMTDITLPATQGVYLLRVSGENTHIVRKLTR